MAFLAIAAKPFVWLLDASSNVLLRLFGLRQSGEHSLTAEELHMLFAEATRSGVIEEQERAILSGVMRLTDRPVRELMTPRTGRSVRRMTPERIARSCSSITPEWVASAKSMCSSSAVRLCSPR